MAGSDPVSFNRQPDESERAWTRRVKKHIRKNAPAEQRFYVRHGMPGVTGQRWILPGIITLLGLGFFIGGYINGATVRELNGPNGAQGQFVVQDVTKRYHETKTQSDPYTVPVVTIRGQSVVPLNADGKNHTYAVGDVVSLKYTKTGDPAASFANDDGTVSNTPSYVLMWLGVLLTVFGIVFGKYYRGAVEPYYVETEFARLTK